MMNKKIIFLFLIGSITIFSCSTEGDNSGAVEKSFDREKTIQQIEKIEASLVSDKNQAMNYKEAKEIVGIYRNFVNELPTDPLSPEYMFKMGEVQMGLGEYLKAEKAFNHIYNNYPNYKKRIESLYLVAFINDVHLKQKGKAKETYEKIIQKHPDHGLAHDAKGAISILTLSDDELIKMFEEKNAKDKQD